MRKNLENILSTKTRWLNTKASRKPCFKKMPQVYLRTFPKKVWLPNDGFISKTPQNLPLFFCQGPSWGPSLPARREGFGGFHAAIWEGFCWDTKTTIRTREFCRIYVFGWGIVYGCFILPPTTVHQFLVFPEPRSLSFGEPCPIAGAGDGFSWPRCMMGLGSFVRLTTT